MHSACARQHVVSLAMRGCSLRQPGGAHVLNEVSTGDHRDCDFPVLRNAAQQSTHGQQQISVQGAAEGM